MTIGNSMPTFFSCFSTTTTTTTTKRNNYYYYNYIKNKLQLQKFIITAYVYNIKYNHNIMYVLYCIACQQLCYSNCICRVLSFVDTCDLCLSILLNHKIKHAHAFGTYFN